MLHSYAKLLEIQAWHGFYPDGVCRVLRIEPTAPSGRWLSELRMRMHPLPGGLAVYGLRRADGSSEIPLPDPLDLLFAVKVQDPSFHNFTELPALPNGAVYLYLPVDSRVPLQLHRAAVTAGALPKLQEPNRAGSVRLTLLGRSGQVLGEEMATVVAGEVQPRLSLAGHPEGLYRLESSGEDSRWIYLHARARPSWFALVRMRFAAGELSPAEARIHRIELTARAVLWDYRVIVRRPEADSASTYQIVHQPAVNRGRDAGSEDEPLHFSAPEEWVMADGRRMLRFVSVTAGNPWEPARIPFSELPRGGITLERTKAPNPGRPNEETSAPAVIVANLPNPSPKQFEPIVTVHI
jgi:hypothetical protein